MVPEADFLQQFGGEKSGNFKDNSLFMRDGAEQESVESANLRGRSVEMFPFPLQVGAAAGGERK